MKHNILLTAFLIMCFVGTTQAPNKMSYQAVVRDADNNLVSNQTVGLKVIILSGAPDGTSVYNETHTINSNVNGLVSIIIGEGNNQSGSFASINWTSNTHYIKTEIDPNGGSNYTITGVQQLLSVPYALHANTADNLGGAEGTQVGEMLYWDGSTWANIPVGPKGSVLTNCWDNIPTWGYCLDTVLPGEITATTAKITGRLVTGIVAPQSSERGICYNTSPIPTVNDFKKVINYNSEYFTTVVGGLTPNTTYYARSYLTDNSGTSYGREVSFTTTNNLSIGDYYPEEGGVIFYILQPGDAGYDPNQLHGLILSVDSLGDDRWGCQGTEIGNTSPAMFTGLYNTNLIANACPDSAAFAVLNFSSMGFDDWYLGSYSEMVQLTLNRSIVNSSLESINGDTLILDSSDSDYWTSTELNANNAIFKYLDGSTNLTNRNKNGNVKVRPVRTF